MSTSSTADTRAAQATELARWRFFSAAAARLHRPPPALLANGTYTGALHSNSLVIRFSVHFKNGVGYRHRSPVVSCGTASVSLSAGLLRRSDRTRRSYFHPPAPRYLLAPLPGRLMRGRLLLGVSHHTLAAAATGGVSCRSRPGRRQRRPKQHAVDGPGMAGHHCRLEAARRARPPTTELSPVRPIPLGILARNTGPTTRSAREQRSRYWNDRLARLRHRFLFPDSLGDRQRHRRGLSNCVLGMGTTTISAGALTVSGHTGARTRIVSCNHPRWS